MAHDIFISMVNLIFEGQIGHVSHKVMIMFKVDRNMYVIV